MKPTYLILIGLVLVLAACGTSPTATLTLPATSTAPGQPTATLAPTITVTPAIFNPAASAIPAGKTPETPDPYAPRVGATPTLPPPQGVAKFPDPANYVWKLVVGQLNRPVGVVNAGDGSDRLFIVEQNGYILVVENGALQAAPLLDIHNEVSCCGEQGLLGLAFHPEYFNNRYFYVNYTDVNGDTVIARYQVAAGLGGRAHKGSALTLLTVDQPYANHNGGGLAFGPDTYLYIGLGDGGSAGDPENRAQDLNTLLGKLLRIDVDSATPYAIPADNPLALGGGRPEIWAYGLRNPWRFSFDWQTGDLYIGDVGQSELEEIDFFPAQTPGAVALPAINFGWPYLEGTQPYRDQLPEGQTAMPPVAEYSHSEGCSVTGGVVYRGMNLPDWQGVYFYGDYCSGRIWGLLRTADGAWHSQLLFETGAAIVSFGEDEAGEIYLVDFNGGLYQLIQK
jgi:glucose/arabinose dehydrogenase